MQVVVAKLTYHPVGGIRGIVRYVEHDGPDKDGNRQERVVGFDETSDAVDSRAITAEWRSDEDPRYWHLIVSPENGDQIADMKTVVRPAMEQVQRDLGTRVQWLGFEHDRDKDAKGRHVHVLIRGVDRRGQELLIAREYATTVVRYRFAERVTKEIGPRSEQEIQRGLTRSQQIREHREEKDRLMNTAIERRAITRTEAEKLNKQYVRSGQEGKQQVVQQIRKAIDRTPDHDPEMTR